VKQKIAALKKRSSLIFLFLGLFILACLIYFMDTRIILESFELVGAKIFLVFAIAPLWITCNTLCLSTLLKHQVPFPNLLYNQVTGDAYNVITPFAGLGGEPYKVTHLTNWISIDTASEGILRDRLIHSLSGLMYTGIMTLVVVTFMPLEQKLFYAFTGIGLLLTIFSALLSFLILSNVPNKFLGGMLKKLKLLENFHSNPLKRSTFLQALFLKLLGRGLNLLEFITIFFLLGIQPAFLEIVTISAMLALSGTLLFIVPQGIGVNEAGISGAFKLVGRSADLGLSVGLIRRARVLFWAFLGVGLHLLVTLFRRLRRENKELKMNKEE